MAEPKIRKQIYLSPDHDLKLKALAARRGTTESQIIHEAVERLPSPDDDWTEQLHAEGIFAPKLDVRDYPHVPGGADADLEPRAFEAWLDAKSQDLRLSEAVNQDRGPR